MEPELNCSSHCSSPLCFIHSGVNRQEGLDILQKLCSLSKVAVELPRRSLSPALSAVVWTLLSCGILLAFCFLLFTLRFKNNRIVKMSSPNLNVLTLFGSLLTYSSGFLFAIDERTHSQGGPSTAVLQARMWTLCVGSTLVFGPILGKTWRLYRVFTQRVPDKRVIIRDIQLMGMVALLILVDTLVLTTWNLTDPIRCSRSVGAVVKVAERDISYSLSQLDSCSSVYSKLWAIIIAVQKGCLLLYGTYLAGLTSNVSHPPVNQSPTIITAVTLVTLCSAVVVPVSIFLQAWPNLVYSTVAGAIFICTLATNCMLFVPQLTQWRQFEEDQNNPGQMAKYFSSPSKSQLSVYSQDEIYYLLGENNSMKKLLNEKNAVIDSLQEQVNNAKDKLLRLVSASQTCEDQDMDSSATNLNSSSTRTTELQSDGPSSSSLPQRDTRSQLSTPHLTAAAVQPSSEHPTAPNSSNPITASSPLLDDMYVGDNQKSASISGPTDKDTAESRTEDDLKQPVSLPSAGLLRTAEETVNFVTSLQDCRGLNPFQVETFGNHSGLTSQLEPNARPPGFVSSEQLQEILQELSLDAVTESTLRSPGQTARTPSQLKFTADSTLSPLSPWTPGCPHPPVLFRYPSISPYAMRKRRPPFNSSRRSLTPLCFYTGCGKLRENCEHPNPGKHHDGVIVDGTLLQVPHCDLELEEEEEEEAERQEVMRKSRRCVSRSHRCSVLHCAEHNHTARPDVEAVGDNEQHHRRIRDSCGYWDSDSSSSTDYCYYHRPYCDSCLQRGSFLSSDSSSDSSDSEYEGYTSLYRSPHPVVFKEDLKPTFV
ncbi:probable G-protein coupled receptor 156 isoform X2 [Xiphias gladius]|uniref:probable G-protein coupled receptor 156 isoform X2 n=1 Tax=Xiphias gladius TaxID=8245 RepID=UPI001A98BFF3|nr:probable G-protein coupled receptor 156 isoform X2 [Xiphias gladius]